MDAAVISRAFDNARSRIAEQARYLSRCYHVSHDEVLSECYFAFVDACHRHDPAKSAFETWLINRMRFQIMRFIEKRGRLSLREVSFTDYASEFDPGSIIDARTLHARLLSDDAITAIALALKPPAPVMDHCLRLGGEKRHLRRALRDHLRSRGWSCGRVRRTFLEVREALENEDKAKTTKNQVVQVSTEGRIPAQAI